MRRVLCCCTSTMLPTTKMFESWTPAALPDLSVSPQPLHCLVTGANSGIGYQTARHLALKNANVILTGRNPDKGTRAVNSIQRELPKAGTPHLEWINCDLAELRNVQTLADTINEHDIPLNRLACIAGQFLPPHQITVDGIEVQLQVNYFSQFLLAHLLLDRLQRHAPSRIVFMGSSYHNLGVLDWDDLRGVTAGESDLPQYATANLFKIMTAQEMRRRLVKKGIHNVDVFAVHPGLADTSLFGKTDTQKPTAWLNRAADALTGKDAETASYSSIYATAEPSIQGSSFMYFGPTGVGLGPLQVDHTGAREPHHPAASDANAMFRLYEETVAILEKALGHPLPNRL